MKINQARNYLGSIKSIIFSRLWKPLFTRLWIEKAWFWIYSVSSRGKCDQNYEITWILIPQKDELKVFSVWAILRDRKNFK